MGGALHAPPRSNRRGEGTEASPKPLHRPRPKSAASRRWGAQRSRRRRRGPRGTHRPSLRAAGPARSHEAGDPRQGAGDSHTTRKGRPGTPRALGVALTGAKGVALTPPQTFPARLGAKGEGSSPGVGRWNPGSRAGRGQAGSRPRCDLAEEQWVFRREGASPCPPPPNRRESPCVGYLQGLTPPAAPALAARSPPPRPARGSRARPRLTGRGWLDRPTGWGARRGRRAVLKLWAGTARSPSSLSLAPSLLPPSPSFPDTASRGVMSGARRAEGEGPREAGGGPGRGRPEPGERPQPQPASLRSFGQLWGRAGSPVGGKEGGSGLSKALCAAFARLSPPLRVFSPFSSPPVRLKDQRSGIDSLL